MQDMKWAGRAPWIPEGPCTLENVWQSLIKRYGWVIEKVEAASLHKFSVKLDKILGPDAHMRTLRECWTFTLKGTRNRLSMRISIL